MSQKVNAVLFRRSLRNSESNYKYIKLNKEESSFLLYKNVEIKNYFYNLFKSYGLLILTFKLEFFRSDLIIQVSFLKYLMPDKFKKVEQNKKILLTEMINKFLTTVLNKYYNKKINVVIKLKDLGKAFEDTIIKSKINRIEFIKISKNLKNLKNYPNSSGLIKIAFIVATNKKSSKLLANTLSYLISSQKRRHSNILTFFKKLFSVLIISKLSVISGIRIQISGRINGFPRAKSRLLKLGSLPLQSINSRIDYHESKAYTPNGTFGIKVWICGK